jgi:hypothetical protein
MALLTCSLLAWLCDSHKAAVGATWRAHERVAQRRQLHDVHHLVCEVLHSGLGWGAMQPQ